MSVFRITRAEFAKVFKKPTVYIMAFILAVVLVISLLSYNPTLRQVRSVSIEGDNASVVYNTFIGNSITEDTKTKLDNEYFDKVDTQISFYKKLFDRSNNLKKSFNELNSSYILFSNTFTANNNDASLSDLMDDVKNKFEEVMKNYGDVSAYVNYEKLNNIIIAKNLTNATYFENKYFDINKDGTTYSYNTLKSNYMPQLKSETNPRTFKTYIDTNKYIQIFENLTNYGENLLYNILSDLIIEINKIQSEYIQLVMGELTTENKSLIVQKITDLNTKVNQFKDLVNGLVNNEGIIVINTTNSYKKFDEAFETFLSIYDGIEVDDEIEYNSKKDGAIALKNNDYINKFKEYLDSIVFMDINEEFTKQFDVYSEIVNKNKNTILDRIEKNKTETSTAPILEDITNYMLLGETYKEIINCEIIGQLSKDLSINTAKNAGNIDLSTYNDYNNRNTITTLKYQLDNNIYSNAVGGTFSLHQTISPQKNLYDFTYYALKIATLLITIFTIMMIANLITSETDSGTIKLLLIRPYRRGTILLGKILATFFFSMAFLFLSFVISMVAGYFMFGLPSIENVLVTFNATKPFMIKPIYLILIFFASCAGDILFYLIIALTISVLFRSYIGAISTSLITYIGSMVVGSLLSNSVIYAYLPFTNISWFRFFGGEITPVKSGIGALLSAPVHSLQYIWLSIGISTIFSLILLIITFISFKRRDF